MDHSDLRKKWHSVWRRVGKETPDVLFDKLATRYSEAGRYYHTLEHIGACLDWLEHVPALGDTLSIELAIWYHDCVYDSRRHDNEERSAEIARDELAEFGVADGIITSVSDLILATKLHQPSSPEAELLCDIDFTILGSPASVFATYEENIRKEYAWVSDVDFARGRLAILQSFVQRPRIFRTSYFYELLENRARKNLTHSITELSDLTR